MISACLYAAAVIGAWLAASPFALSYGGAPAVAVPVAAGAAVMILATVGGLKALPTFGGAVAMIGTCLTAWGVAGFVFPDLGIGPNEVVAGVALLVFGGLSAVIPSTQHVRAYDMYGNTLADISKLSIKRGDIVATSVLLESMPSTLYLRPEEVWKLLGLMGWDVVRRLPRFLVTGARRARTRTAL
ncbi:MAG: hypothetical protein LBK95_13195 [Bifidobacteriaceae bacterium]|jgi:hypothetical protein|nr:hypothetical protein [Bifidobacteriaceae bacterium]